MRFTTIAATAAFLFGCSDTSSTSAPAPAASAPPTADAGGPVVLASGQSRPWTIAIDEENIYWVNASATGGVYKMSKGGGTPTALYEGQMGSVESLGLDSAAIYFPIATETDVRIVSVPIGGGPAKTLAPGARANGVAVANGSVYWIERVSAPASDRVAKRVSTSGGNVETLSLPPGMPLDASNVTVSAADAVYASTMRGGIVRIPTDGGPPKSLSSGWARGLAVDKDQVFFASNNSIEAVPTAGGTTKRLALVDEPFGIAADDSFVYFIDGMVGRVNKVPKAGGPVTLVADDRCGGHAIVVDRTSVYWNCISQGTIKKFAK